MKKKVISVILASVVALSLVACGGTSQPAATSEKTVVEEKNEAVAPVAAEENKEEATPAVVENKEEATPDVVDEKEEAVASETTDLEETASATESDDFTILDVTTDLVDVGIYAVDDNNTEYVVTLFRDPDQNQYISLMQVAEDGSGDLICGAYDDSCVEVVPDEENGVDWTVININDVYTDTECTIIFAEGDDGSVAISNDDFSIIMEGEYLSNEDTITYMGAAVSFIE